MVGIMAVSVSILEGGHVPWFCVTVWLCFPCFCTTMAPSDFTMDDDRYNPEPYGVQHLGDHTA